MENIIIPALFFSALILWLLALIDLVGSRFKRTRYKLAWLLVILFFPLVGSILYLLLREDFKLQRRRRFSPDFHKSRRS